MDTVERELEQLLKTFTPEQLEFVAMRLLCRTDKEASERLKMSYDTILHWTNKKDVNHAVSLAKIDSVVLEREKLRRLTPKAVGVLDDEMGAGKKDRIVAAKEVLDRTGIVVGKRVEHTGSGGGPIGIVNVDLSSLTGAELDALATIADKLEDGDQEGTSEA